MTGLQSEYRVVILWFQSSHLYRYTIRWIKNNWACKIVAREVMSLGTMDACRHQEGAETKMWRCIDVNLIKSKNTETERVKCQEIGDWRKSGWVPDVVRMPWLEPKGAAVGHYAQQPSWGKQRRHQSQDAGVTILGFVNLQPVTSFSYTSLKSC